MIWINVETAARSTSFGTNVGVAAGSGGDVRGGVQRCLAEARIQTLMIQGEGATRAVTSSITDGSSHMGEGVAPRDD